MEPTEERSNSSELTNFDTQYKLDIITDLERDVIAMAVGVIVCEIISFFGTITNIMNMIIFYKQGLNTTINISFFSLAISDLGSLIFQQLCGFYSNPLFVKLDLPIVYHEFQYLTTAIIRELFAQVTCLITVYITAERCICVAFPLHVKQLITTRKATTIIICVFVTIFLSGSPAYGGISYIDWKFYPNRNRTLLGLVYRKNTRIADGVVYLMHATLGIVSFTIMVFLTSVLIYKLRQKSTWLKNSNVDQAKSEIMANRDKATMFMVVLIASLLIICYLPSVILFPVTIIEPEFAIGERYNNLFIVLWAIALLMEDVNSSVNIFFYYKMSTKYRHTFRAVFFKMYRPSPIMDHMITDTTD